VSRSAGMAARAASESANNGERSQWTPALVVVLVWLIARHRSVRPRGSSWVSVSGWGVWSEGSAGRLAGQAGRLFKSRTALPRSPATRSRARSSGSRKQRASGVRVSRRSGESPRSARLPDRRRSTRPRRRAHPARTSYWSRNQRSRRGRNSCSLNGAAASRSPTSRETSKSAESAAFAASSASCIS
jgi:hypothetical protein